MKEQVSTSLTLVLVLAITWMEVATLPATKTCVATFERLLNEITALRRNCKQRLYLHDCCEIAELSGPGVASGIYNIKDVCHATTPFNEDIITSTKARCDMESSDGGWTVLVRRTPDVDKRELFNRTWEEYENGFGDLDGEFWYGLKNMHCLTNREPMEVEVEVRKNDGTKLLLPYVNFRVDGPSTSYTLHVSEKGYEDSHSFLGYHNGMQFSTLDRDNDQSGSSCSTAPNGVGWWFNACYQMALTKPGYPVLYKNTNLPYDYAELRVRTKKCTGLPKEATC